MDAISATPAASSSVSTAAPTPPVGTEFVPGSTVPRAISKPSATSVTGGQEINSQTIAENAKPGETSSQTVKRMLKAKVDGKEVEVSEEDAIVAWQKGKSADKRFQEAAVTRKQAEQFLGMLKKASTDPSVLEQLFAHPLMGNANYQEIAEKYLYSKIQQAQMTPEQRELAEARQKLAQIEAEKKAFLEAEEQTKSAELEKKYSEDYHKDIIQTLEGSQLPKSEWAVKRLANYMHMGLKRGVELKASDVLPLVVEDYKTEFKSLFGGLPGDKLLDILGDDVAKSLRELDLAKVRGGNGGVKTPTIPNLEQKPKKSLTMEEFKARARARAGV